MLYFLIVPCFGEAGHIALICRVKLFEMRVYVLGEGKKN